MVFCLLTDRLQPGYKALRRVCENALSIDASPALRTCDSLAFLKIEVYTIDSYATIHDSVYAVANFERRLGMASAKGSRVYEISPAVR